MKTYTIEQYNEYYGGSLCLLPRPGDWNATDQQRFDLPSEMTCNCIRVNVLPNFDKPAAWADCDNCLGYGIMPIPPSELR